MPRSSCARGPLCFTGRQVVTQTTIKLSGGEVTPKGCGICVAFVCRALQHGKGRKLQLDDWRLTSWRKVCPDKGNLSGPAPSEPARKKSLSNLLYSEHKEKRTKRGSLRGKSVRFSLFLTFSPSFNRETKQDYKGDGGLFKRSRSSPRGLT